MMKRNNSYSFQSRQHIIKSVEAKAKAERKFGDIIADEITSRVGSMAFFGINAVWFVLWMVINLGYIPWIRPFDPYPFGLLTMIVSLEAIFLSIIVLISQNREAKTDILREEVDLQINTLAEEEITEIIKLLIKLLHKHGIRTNQSRVIQRMIKPTDAEKIERSIERQIEK